MKYFSSSLQWIRIAVLVLASPLIACQSARLNRIGVVEQGNVKTYLEHYTVQEKPLKREYDHPAFLQSADMESLLNRFTYENDLLFRETKPYPVFSKENASVLAKALVKTLAEARFYQHARFLVMDLEKGSLFKSPRKTEGVIFMESGNRLNIVFACIAESQDSKEIFSPEFKPSYENPLDIMAVDHPLCEARGFAFHSMAERNGEAEENRFWAVVDLDTFKVTIPPANVQTRPEIMQPNSASIPDATDGNTQDVIRWRLDRLKAYHRDGLITDKEYAEKKKQLLDQL